MASQLSRSRLLAQYLAAGSQRTTVARPGDFGRAGSSRTAISLYARFADLSAPAARETAAIVANSYGLDFGNAMT
jgi:hypothetical protein